MFDKSKFHHILSILFLALFFTACFEEDDRVSPHVPGDETVVEIQKNIYDSMLYFDLSSNRVVQSFANNDWHLAFECGEEGWQIRLNSAPYLYIRHTGSTDFDGLTSVPDGYDWVFDWSNGNRDSTAIDEWVSFSETDTTYSNEVILLGSYNGLNYSVKKKFVFTHVDESKYEFRFSNLDGSEDVTFSLNKDESVDFVYFSTKDGGSIIPQLAKTEWDFLFCQYSTIIFDTTGIPTPYSLRGVLINPNGVEVAKDTSLNFTDITPKLTVSK